MVYNVANRKVLDNPNKKSVSYLFTLPIAATYKLLVSPQISLNVMRRYDEQAKIWEDVIFGGQEIFKQTADTLGFTYGPLFYYSGNPY